MSFIEKYKSGLALFIGTICLFVALFLPGRYALSAEMHKEFDSVWDVWTSINWIFLVLGIIFLWGEIVKVAKSVGDGVGNVIDKKTS